MHQFAASKSDLALAKRAHVVGNPARHSLSPKIHNAAYRYLNLPFEYSALEVTESECLNIIDLLKNQEIFGLSFTMPYKDIAFNQAEVRSELAEKSKVANTLVYRNQKICGENTDIHGIKQSIIKFFDPDYPWTVLGTGATARSAICALQELGAEEIFVVGRDVSKLNYLSDFYGVVKAEFQDKFPNKHVLSTVPGSADLLIEAIVNDSMFLFDVNYASWPTALANEVLKANGKVVSGLDMLVHQAHKQIEIMTGHSVPVEVLFSAVA